MVRVEPLSIVTSVATPETPVGIVTVVLLDITALSEAPGKSVPATQLEAQAPPQVVPTFQLPVAEEVKVAANAEDVVRNRRDAVVKKRKRRLCVVREGR